MISGLWVKLILTESRLNVNECFIYYSLKKLQAAAIELV